MLSSLVVLSLLISLGDGPQDVKAFQGKWKVTAVFEDGKSLSEKEIASQLFVDGTINIDGPVITFLGVGSFEPRKLGFTVNAQAEPKAINLVGTTKTGSKGIYLVDGDSLMVCLAGSNEGDRPRDFGAGAGSGQVLLVFKRAKDKENAIVAHSADQTKRVPQLPAAPTSQDEMRKSLIGTWGHQNDDAVMYYTLNADGTFSTVTEWKSGLKKAFNDNIRASGTWKLENGIIIATVTAATESNMRNQIYSWRITNLGPSNLIAIDGQGRLRQEWRVR
jgi:uncharacterized protein (TIGR03067 family)